MRKFLKDFSRTEIRDIAINYSQNPLGRDVRNKHLYAKEIAL